MPTRPLPASLVVPAKKGAGSPAHCAAPLSDGSFALVAGRSQSWQRVAILSPALEVVREMVLVEGGEDSQPDRCITFGDRIVVCRRWGENVALDPHRMAKVTVPDVFLGAATGVVLDDGLCLSATRAENRGQKTELRFAEGVSSPPKKWSVALLESVAEAWGANVAPPQQCGLLVAAGDELLIGSFTTLPPRPGAAARESLATPTLSRVAWRTGAVLGHARDLAGLARDGDIHWDAASRELVAVDPVRETVERWSPALELVEEAPSHGFRLLAMNEAGEGLWLAPKTHLLTRTGPRELPRSDRDPLLPIDTTRRVFPAFELLGPLPKTALRHGDRVALVDGHAPTITGLDALRLERVDATWRMTTKEPVSVNGARAAAATLAHGDVLTCGASWRFLERDWVVARDPATEAAIADAPEDPERLRAYGAWLAERGDPLGHRMLAPSTEETDDIRWLGPALGPLLTTQPASLEVEWSCGLVRAATLRDDLLMNVNLAHLIGAEIARFLRRLTLHPSPLILTQVLQVLASPSIPSVSTRTPHVSRSLERVVIHAPGRTDNRLIMSQAALHQALFAQAQRRWPRLRTTWEDLFAE